MSILLTILLTVAAFLITEIETQSIINLEWLKKLKDEI